MSQSAAYRRFTTYCCEAFNILRKYAPLVINMHSLMKDASIPDFVKTGGDAIPLSRGVDGWRCALTGCVRGGAERGINVLLERFRLDMTDEDAVQHFQDLMDESVTSLMPKLCVPAPPWRPPPVAVRLRRSAHGVRLRAGRRLRTPGLPTGGEAVLAIGCCHLRVCV